MFLFVVTTKFKKAFFAFALSGMAAGTIAQDKAILPQPPFPPPPFPPPSFRPVDLREDEKPVDIALTNEVIEANGLFRRVRTTITFTNPNPRDFSGDLEFPVPDGATVCGYALEIDGAMITGVVTEKEKARVAFESEKAKRVDPGIVEHVKGNIWKTRIFPLHPKNPRKASVDYIKPIAEGDALTLCEKDGEDVFVGMRGESDKNAPSAKSVADRIATFAKGVIVWDASGSAKSFADSWRKKLDALPDMGDWILIAFRESAEAAPFTQKTALLKAIDDLVYDGGTDIGAAMARPEVANVPVLLFTDEIDTLGLDSPQYEKANVIVAGRDDAPSRAVTVRKLAPGEKTPEGAEVKEGTLIATAWAANRVADLASQAESRKAEFLELGRKYGVASSVTSLIVLESLDQYLTHKIEPPKAMSFHDEWVRRRAAEDDQIAKKEANAEHERDMLRLWKERVEWWNNPIPPKRTPKSGLFDNAGRATRERALNMEDGMDAEAAPMVMAANEAPSRALDVARSAAPRDTGEAGGGGATITFQPWNPDSPYLKKIADEKEPYVEYLAQRKEHGSSPAFFMDCASWFFKKGDATLGWRILSNMAEFKLEDASVWRSMGWRLREAGQYDEAVLCLRHALRLRGEEGQSRRDLALVLAERGKSHFDKDPKDAAADLAEAMALLREAAFTNFARRSGRRSNDRQVSIVALEELNALIGEIEVQ